MTAIAHHRVNTTYFVALDIVIGEIKERFTVDDQDILCALGDVALSNKPSEDSEDKVANFYELNKDLIQAERLFVFNFLSQSAYETKKNTYCIGTIHVGEEARHDFANIFPPVQVLSCDYGYVVLNGAKATQLPCSQGRTLGGV